MNIQDCNVLWVKIYFKVVRCHIKCSQLVLVLIGVYFPKSHQSVFMLSVKLRILLCIFSATFKCVLLIVKYIVNSTNMVTLYLDSLQRLHIWLGEIQVQSS